jgi:hypothetical protein
MRQRGRGRQIGFGFSFLLVAQAGLFVAYVVWIIISEFISRI